jgi:uncharacterized protein
MYGDLPYQKQQELQFNVAQLLKEATGGTREYDLVVPLTINLDDIKPVAPFVGHIKFLRTGPNILVTGSLQGLIEKNCGRCLTPFITSLEIDLEEEFYPTIDINTGKTLSDPVEVDLANRIDDQNILDLTEVIRQELLLASDGILNCRAECKGLCPYCGQDRNKELCGCAENQIDARWAGLLTKEIEDN